MRRQRLKWLFLISLLLTGQTILASETRLDPTRLKQSKVKYVHHYTVKVFPAPVFAIKRSGLASGPQEIAEIREKIVYPLIVESVEPVTAIIAEFFSEKRNEIGVGVYWSNGVVRESLIARDPEGHYDTDGYRVFFKKPTP